MKPKVIVLEDDDASRKLISLVLQQNGYEVISAPDPTACPLYTHLEERCTKEHPCCDFLLTDNRMPNMTGLEFIEVQSQRGCKAKAENKAVMSGSWTQEERDKAHQLGCKIFKKPYRMNEILAWLTEQKRKLYQD